MRALIDICRFATVSGVILFVGCVNAVAADRSIAETEKGIEESRMAWNRFLSANCSDDDTEQTIRKLMHGKYRDVALLQGSKETYELLFLIDDFHQVSFGFYDKNSRLVDTPRIEPKGQWLRMPCGYVKSIPSPAETRLKSKVAEAALEYIVNHTNHKRGSLSVDCIRSDKAQTWDVVGAVKSLQLDPPGYVLEITNDGVVVKGPFEDEEFRNEKDE